MTVIDWEALVADGTAPRPSALTVGVFDGVHRGHQALIARVTSRAGEGLQPVIVTFRNSPRRVLTPETAPAAIASCEEKLALFEQLGVARTVLITFTREFSRLGAEAFLDILVRRAGMRVLVVGPNFHCGHGGAAGVESLLPLCAARGVELEVAPPVMDAGEPVSSSRVRAALARGDLSLATRLLGVRAERGGAACPAAQREAREIPHCAEAPSSPL